MTMVPTLRCPRGTRVFRREWVACCLVVVTSASFFTPQLVKGQTPDVHYRHRGDMPPGAIGRWQLQRGGPLPGYFQPVEIKVPAGAKISLVESTNSAPGDSESVLAGLLIGPVYRLRVTQIPFQIGAEVYPTVEVIDRLYPPPRQAARFPIAIEITQDDLELALDGMFVVRVIYLEDPRYALPIPGDRNRPHWFDVEPGEDPLQTADALGRPVAIVRIGGRLPLEHGGPGTALETGSPPVLRFASPRSDSAQQSGAGASAPALNDGPQAGSSAATLAEAQGHE